MFGFGVPELVLILVIGLMVFGPGKLPSIGQAVGPSIRELKSEVIEKPQENITIKEDKV